MVSTWGNCRPSMPAMTSSWECTCSASGWAKTVRMAAAISLLPRGTRASTLRMKWACKGSSCRRVGGGPWTCNGGKERGCGGEPLLGGHWDVADLLENHGDLAGRGAQGAPADLEQLGERLVAAKAPLVEHGGQHAFGVGELLGEDATAGSGQPFSAAAAVTVALVAGGQDGQDALGQRGQVGARHAGQRRVGEQGRQLRPGRWSAAA